MKKEELAGFFRQVLPEAIVGDFVEMTLSMLPGGLLENETSEFETDRGTVPLVEAVGAIWQKRKE